MSDAQNVVEEVSRPVLLRAAREAAGLHIAAMAAALKVPVRKLEALEAGRYNELPDMTFARALASSACRHLKVDPAPILQQIPIGVAPELGGSRQAINAPFKPASDPAPVNLLSWLSRPAMLAAIVLLLGALVIVFLPRAQEPQAVSAGDTVITPVEPVAAVEPGSAPVPVDAAGVASTPSVPMVVTPVAPTPEAAPVLTAPPATTPNAAVTPASTPTPVSTPTPTPGSLLTIAATGESWVEVTNGTGSVVVQRMLKPGDSVDFSTSPPYTVVLGRAESAQVTVRGRPFDVNAIARNNVARFEVK
jgi:cytoskeleton protein RodZ